MSSNKVNWTFHFSLSRKIVKGTNQNPSNIRFVTKNEGGRSWITGFRIIVKKTTENRAHDIATRQASRLANIITAKFSTYHFSTLTQYISSKFPDGKRRGRIIMGIQGDIIRTLDIDLEGRLGSMLRRDSKKNQQLAHFARGIKASEENDPITMIKEFYQVFDENTMPASVRLYRPLRHVLSHDKITRPQTITNLRRNFPQLKFSYRARKVQFDLTSTTKIEILRKIADDLEREASDHVLIFYRKLFNSIHFIFIIVISSMF